MPLLKFVLVAKPSEVQLNNMKSNPVSSKDEWGMPKSNLGKKCLELAQSSHCRYCDGWNNDTRLKCRGDIKQEALDIFELLTQSRKEAVEETIEKWRQAIYYSEDTKSCLDRKIMLNHFNEAKLKTNTK
jgi:hypothetical protein